MYCSSKDSYYTLDKIPQHRIEYITKRVKDFIKDFELKYWPIDCVKLILKIQEDQCLPIHMKSISKLSHKTDAATVYSRELDNFLIIVNKNKIHYPFEVSKHRRLNFTLAHEIAHIYLKHYELPDKYKTENDLYIEELEADEFAGRILMPESKICTCNFTSLENVAEHFNVSEWAVLKRLSNLKCSHLRFSKTFLVCENCENVEVHSTDNYCKICGMFLKNGVRGITTMQYDDGFKINENTMKVSVCPKCGNSVIGDSDEYCPICGQYLFNECTNDCGGYHTTAPGNARYCPKCGNVTTFFNSNVLHDWKPTREALLNKMQFEENLSGTLNTAEDIKDWDTIGFTLFLEGYTLLSTLLENSTAKQCGETLVVYVKDTYIKDRILNCKNVGILTSLAKSQFKITVNDIKITALEDFYPVVEEPVPIDDEDIPF
ncbi:ImmA/IrrE family metallo-endopeptidase [Clostridium drakei]|uniref:IrrE N-terminal-like domain-containing protein n=1 Tax=Clostridium drakei TaxID=332101 RepID=A0A2U8DLA5_9CLOT|nr:ImmA/IrrE family metallo-endopeptidase [Clostridium drakei]AWI03476.1 hypothetical protein B9W14_02910 [Clostridium drakei]